MWNNYLPNSITIHDVAFWVDGFGGSDRKNGTAYTFANTAEGVKTFAGQAITFNGTSTQVTVGNNGEDIKTIVMWVNPASSDEVLIDLDGSADISIASSNVTATGWTSPTIYTNDLENTTIDADEWTLISVTSDTGITASAVEIGTVGASFTEGSITQVIGFTKALSQLEINQIFWNGSSSTTSGVAIVYDDGVNIVYDDASNKVYA